MMLNLKKRFKDLSIRSKINRIYIPLLIVPFLLSSLVLNYISSQAIIQKTFEITLDESVLISGKIDIIINNIEISANDIVKGLNNINDSHDITMPYDNQMSALTRKNAILDELAYAMSPDIDCIIFIDNHGIVYRINCEGGDNNSQGFCNECIKKVDITDGENIWFPVKSTLAKSDSNGAVLILGKKVLDRNSMKKLGFLFIALKESSISDVYQGIGPISGKGYFIADQSGLIVSSIDKNKLLSTIKDEELRPLTFGGKNISKIKGIGYNRALLTSVPIKSLKWHLINEIPLRDLTSDADKVTFVIVTIEALCLLAGLLGAKVLSNYISKPILLLAEKMQSVKEGSLDTFYSIDSKDEIGTLASGFNTMLIRIKELLKNIRLEQEKQREIELSLMQAQIKPHFLYNTLNLIYVLCHDGCIAEAKEATKALADFYRTVLNDGNEMTTIGEELRNIESYLRIQRIRHSFEFDCRINIGIDILDGLIPKLTVQPVVENAIFHGLQPKGFGNISIEGFEEEGKIILKVADDGAGIEPDKLEHLLENNQDGKTAFGISNVNERLKLYFGEDYGLKVVSESEKGTTVTITVPDTDKKPNQESESYFREETI